MEEKKKLRKGVKGRGREEKAKKGGKGERERNLTRKKSQNK